MAAQKQKKNERINLLLQKGLEATTTGRILTWILSTFRIIVIVTEIIVMIAFLSRFWYDAQNTDLGEEITQKQAVIAVSSDFENDFKKTQDRLKIYSSVTSENNIISNSLKSISSNLPNDVFLTNFAFSENGIGLDASTPNERSIQQTVVNIKSSGTFEKVQLKNIETNRENRTLLNFKIQVTL